jgi:hypothetical protein
MTGLTPNSAAAPLALDWCPAGQGSRIRAILESEIFSRLLSARS